MKVRGRIKDLSLDYRSRLAVITLTADCDPSVIEEYGNKDLDISISEHKEKRSLTANSYYWVLAYQLAALIGTSTTELHDELLQRYGLPYTDDEGKHVVIALKSRISVKALGTDLHWKKVQDKGDLTAWMMLKGSSQMNSKEFSRLLDGLISECKGVGIETMTPSELERLKGYER